MKSFFIRLALCLMPMAAVQAADLEIILNGVKPGPGKLQVVVFDNEADFKAGKHENAYATLSARKHGEVFSFTLANIKPGSYAIGVIDDANNNLQLDMQDGLPTEGYSTSNAKNSYFHPDFAGASIKVDKQNVSSVLTMFYLKQKPSKQK